MLNLPVRWRGETLGTLNLLHQAGHYEEAHVAPARALAQMAVPAMLMLERD